MILEVTVEVARHHIGLARNIVYSIPVYQYAPRFTLWHLVSEKFFCHTQLKNGGLLPSYYVMSHKGLYENGGYRDSGIPQNGQYIG